MIRIETLDVATPTAVRAVFTTRRGGTSEGPFAGLNLGVSTGDDPSRVGENRRRLTEHLGVDPSRVVMTNQVHGTSVRRVEAPDDAGRFIAARTGWAEGDGLATTAAGTPLMVLGADCLPILLWRTDGTGVAAVHAGWRGLIDGVVRSGVTALDDGPVAAAIGPGAGVCCYEVDARLRTRFTDRYGSATVVGDNVDLAAAARVALEEAGVASGDISDVGRCTVCDSDRFFSHRRDGARSGRQAGLIWRVGE